MNAILEVQNLAVSFPAAGGLRAVDGVSFSLREAERLGITGESGCGKTVTALSILNLIAGFGGVIDSGRILFCGENLLTLSEQRLRAIRGREIAYISQDAFNSLHPLFPVKEQLLEVFSIHHIKLPLSEKMNKIYAVLESLGFSEIDKLLRKYPFELSGGMSQRIVIAMSLLLDAKIILADEPTTALDVSTQADIIKRFLAISREYRCALLLISHDIGVIHELAERVCVMYHGKIMEERGRENLFKRPGHPYTRALIRSLPKNYAGRFPVMKNYSSVPPGKKNGCPFAARCEEKLPVCDTAPPLPKTLADGGISWCRLTEK